MKEEFEEIKDCLILSVRPEQRMPYKVSIEDSRVSRYRYIYVPCVHVCASGGV